MSYSSNNPYIPGDPYSYDLKWIIDQLKTAINLYEPLSDDFETLYNYVHDYFDNLDLSEEVQTIINQMETDGYFNTLIQSIIDDSGDIQSAVTNWLESNVDPTGSAVTVDKSLSISESAADAKTTGLNFTNINNAIPNYNLFDQIWQTGNYITNNYNSAIADYICSVNNIPISGYVFIAPIEGATDIYITQLDNNDTYLTHTRFILASWPNGIFIRLNSATTKILLNIYHVNITLSTAPYIGVYAIDSCFITSDALRGRFSGIDAISFVPAEYYGQSNLRYYLASSTKLTSGAVYTFDSDFLLHSNNSAYQSLIHFIDTDTGAWINHQNWNQYTLIPAGTPVLIMLRNTNGSVTLDDLSQYYTLVPINQDSTFTYSGTKISPENKGYLTTYSGLAPIVNSVGAQSLCNIDGDKMALFYSTGDYSIISMLTGQILNSGTITATHANSAILSNVTYNGYPVICVSDFVSTGAVIDRYYFDDSTNTLTFIEQRTISSDAVGAYACIAAEYSTYAVYYGRDGSSATDPLIITKATHAGTIISQFDSPIDLPYAQDAFVSANMLAIGAGYPSASVDSTILFIDLESGQAINHITTLPTALRSDEIEGLTFDGVYIYCTYGILIAKILI